MSDAFAIVPVPLVVQPSSQAPFVITRSTVVVVDADEELVPVAVLTADLLGRVSGRAVEIRYAEPDAPGVVRMRLVEDLPPGPETYRVVVGQGRVRLEARTTDGLVHAVVTLRQLLRERADGGMQVDAVRIEDAPRYPWRGLSLDVARHFVSVPDLRVLIGLMGHYKLNVLHLHLTDDQAWRLDLPSRPELVRRSSAHSVGGDPGGYYSATDWDEILAYARARAIRVVPEIDVPGHVNAALHAYDELNPDGRAPDEYLGIEVGFSRLHDDLPATHAFLADVFGDLADMTPGGYLHIGGDEVLTMAPDEYERLVRSAAAAVTAHGKRVVAWQEVASVAELPAGTVVQYWDTRVDPAPFVAAARAGARLLMSPASKVYLDMKYRPGFPLGQEWAGHVELRDAYDWEPDELVEDLPPDAVVGVEAGLWTETLRTLDDLTTMLLPRLAAVAEVAWSAPDRRDFDDFTARLRAHGRHWDRLGLAWHHTPQGSWDDA
ncbi:family 20 glycosylhydrolase [Cellulomonas wangsupingiae]|uniref:beta-N-acetylhexosaminidase n=1 Tax=Cellulomonas wangsupingiae TaxID=2968085 RepID=A0ABY5K6J8_9CELL|nr:family 20 glycosylhydrolase [Cellulomonas wangsupingiae]MCC2334300.1 beta-N-acetylhexosaminidase [Cellulomonas wangsupingiae]MCM0641299.1 beta-N-acetylhexosaminidase [Cellulomonas wangsupingiae]UUI65975.1 beta-N-acetylhexosaminidase [Cellulomonas wangsupingiae]